MFDCEFRDKICQIECELLNMMLINCHYTPTPLGSVLGFDIFLHKQHSIVCKKYIG